MIDPADRARARALDLTVRGTGAGRCALQRRGTDCFAPSTSVDVDQLGEALDVLERVLEMEGGDLDQALKIAVEVVHSHVDAPVCDRCLRPRGGAGIVYGPLDRDDRVRDWQHAACFEIGLAKHREAVERVRARNRAVLGR
jgi:hypothetical protein